MQRATYSGHKRQNGLKWQALTAPDGLFLNLFGPFEGRRHDMHLYAESGLDAVLGQALMIGGIQHYILETLGTRFVRTLSRRLKDLISLHRELCSTE
jgi:hypothetical protein